MVLEGKAQPLHPELWLGVHRKPIQIGNDKAGEALRKMQHHSNHAQKCYKTPTHGSKQSIYLAGNSPQ